MPFFSPILFIASSEEVIFCSFLNFKGVSEIKYWWISQECVKCLNLVASKSNKNKALRHNLLGIYNNKLF